MLHQNLRFTSIIILLMIASCKKETDGTDNSLSNNTFKLEDGPMSPELGKRINLGGYENLKFWGNQWGRNHQELFVSAPFKVLRLDFTTFKIEVLEEKGGIVVGKAHGNSGVLFLGSIKLIRGYYGYDFNTGSIRKVIGMPAEYASSLHLSGKHAFIYKASLGPPIDPCDDPLEIWCSNENSIGNSTFIYYDTASREVKPLPGKRFIGFSKDGTKAVLSANQSQFIYVYDISTHKITDSAMITGNEMSIYFDDVVKAIETTRGLVEEMIIRDAVANVELHRFTPTARGIYENVYWSEDGSKLYYMGGNSSDPSRVIICVYDLKTREEKIIASFKLLDGGGIAVEEAFLLSPDNKRLLLRYLNDLYVIDLV